MNVVDERLDFRTERVRVRLTQAKVAHITGVSQPVVSRFEAGLEVASGIGERLWCLVLSGRREAA